MAQRWFSGSTGSSETQDLSILHLALSRDVLILSSVASSSQGA